MTSRVSAPSPAEFCAGVERHSRSDEQACGPDTREQFLQSPVSTGAKLESKRLDPWWKTAFFPYWSTSNIFPRTHFFFANESYKEKGGFPRTTWGSLPPMAFSLCRIFFHLLACFGFFLFGSYGVNATMKPTVGVGGTPVMHTITQSASSKAFVFLLGH